MPHHTPLIAAIATGFVLAFIFCALANRLRLSPLFGYLLAGVMVGPFTPGFVSDTGLALELIEFAFALHLLIAGQAAERVFRFPFDVVDCCFVTLVFALHNVLRSILALSWRRTLLLAFRVPQVTY